MVDAERLGRLVDRVRADVARLVALAETHDLVADPVALDAAKYGFVTSIEGCVRAAQHVIASEGLGMPQTNADAVRLLGSAGVVPVGVAEPVARSVGFRNLLVHGYAEVDDDRVRANVALLDDLDAFTTAVAAWAAREA